MTQLEAMSEWAASGIRPDRVVLLQVSPDVAARRRAQRGSEDRIEAQGEEFFDRVATGFEAQARSDPDRWKVVDGSGSIDEVAARVSVAARP